MTSGDVAAAAASIETAFLQLDSAGVESGSHRLHESITCLGEILATPDAANAVRADALARFLAHSTDKVIADYRASAVLQPAYQLPTSIAPEGHPLRAYYQAASALGTGSESPLPAGLVVYADGRKTLARPRDRAVILQYLDPQGSVHSTFLLMPDDPLEPTIPWALLPKGEPPRPQVRGDLDEKRPKKSRIDVPSHRDPVSRPLLVTAGVATLLAGGSYALALSSASEFNNTAELTRDELESIRSRTNAEVLLSGAFGLVAVGCGAGAFVAWRW